MITSHQILKIYPDILYIFDRQNPTKLETAKHYHLSMAKVVVVKRIYPGFIFAKFF